MKKSSRLTLLLLFLLLALLLLLLLLVFLLRSRAHKTQPNILQDICIADLNSVVKVNGFACQPSTTMNNTDFSTMALSTRGATNNLMGSLVTPANVQVMPGLNTLDFSMSRIDFSPGGLNPPHIHPRATEIIFVIEGQLEVSFITTANKLISKTVNKGEVFVFPRGLVHFQENNGAGVAAVIAAFDSQLPGTQSIAATLFAATPTLDDRVLTQEFGIDTMEVEDVKSRLVPKNT